MSLSQVMYTLYDSKAEFYSAPFFAPNETVATRDFHKLIHVTGAISPLYAGDFTLFESIKIFTEIPSLPVAFVDINFIYLFFYE
jgi:hypothetical protein